MCDCLRALHQDPFGGAALSELVCQAALTDPRLTHECHDLAVALNCALKRRLKSRLLPPASDKRREATARARGLHAIAQSSLPHKLEYLLGKARAPHLELPQLA